MQSALPQGVVRVRQGNLDRPLFCLPGIGGGSLQLEPLVSRLQTHRPVYAVESHNLDVELTTLSSLVETAIVIAKHIVQVQPKGPYSILGYSYGGKFLAVEVARILSLDGKRVELLALLDAYAPGTMRRLRGVPGLLSDSAGMDWREARDYLTSRLVHRLRLKVMEPETKHPIFQSDVERMDAKVVELGRQAVSSSRPGPFDQRIFLVNASVVAGWIEINDPSGFNGWGPICTGGIDLIKIDCSHEELLTEPNLSEVVRQLKNYLQGSSLVEDP